MRLPWPLSLFGPRRADAAPLALPAPEPAPAPAPHPRTLGRRDNWTNQATGMGMQGSDATLATYFLATTNITDDEAVDLDRVDPIAAKVINKPVNEAFRPGFELQIVEDDTARDATGQRAGTDPRPARQLARDVEARWQALGAEKAVRKAWKWARREGGAAILLGCVDKGAASGMTTPLAADGPVELRWLRVLRARDLWPARYYSDPSAAKFDEPELWSVSMLGKNAASGTPTMMVHESRLIIFEGEKVVDEAYRGQQHAGFGDSVLLRFYRALRRYGATMAGVERLLARFGQPVMKMHNLEKLMAADNAGDLHAALDAYEYAASTFNVRVLDQSDEYTTTAPSIAGMADLLREVRSELQAAADMPLTILFGDIVGGLGDNNTGAKRDWLDHVASLRQEHAIPPMTTITGLIIRGIGTGTLPGDWKVCGKALWHPTAKEQAEVEKIEADIDGGYLDRQVVTPMQVMQREAVAKRYAIDQGELADLEAARSAMPDDIRTPEGEGDPAAAPGAAPAEIQKQALAAGQVASLLEIVRAVAAKEIARESGIAMVLAAYPASFDAASAAALFPEGFEAEKKPAPPPAFGRPPGVPPDPNAEPVP